MASRDKPTLRDKWAWRIFPTLLLPLIRVGARIDREARRQALCEAYRTADDALVVRQCPPAEAREPDEISMPCPRCPSGGAVVCDKRYDRYFCMDCGSTWKRAEAREPAPAAAEAWDDEDTWEPTFPPSEHGGEG